MAARKAKAAPKRKDDFAYVDAMLKAYVVLSREEARALYNMTKDASLPNDNYTVTLSAIRKLGSAV